MSSTKDFVPRGDYEALLEEYCKVVHERNALQEKLKTQQDLRAMHNKVPE